MNPVAFKTLSYFKAVWLINKPNANLESLIRHALNQKPQISDRKWVESDGITTEIRHVLCAKYAIYLHLASYTPGAQATTVPLAVEMDQADLGTLDAPENQEFMDGDVMLRCAGNDIILCLSGMSKVGTERYLRWLIYNKDDAEVSNNLRLHPVVDIDKASLIAHEGVKAIILNATMHQASSELIEEAKDVGLLQQFKEFFLNLRKHDKSLKDLVDSENLKAQLRITFDGRKKGGLSTGKELVEIAQNVLQMGNGDEYVIETLSHNKISSNKIVLRKVVQLKRSGKTVIHNDAWSEMDKYHDELGPMYHE